MACRRLLALALALAAILASPAAARQDVLDPKRAPATPVVKGEFPRFVDVASMERGGSKCNDGHYCPIEGGVCCKGGAVCCESACNDDSDPPTCDLTKTQKALLLAKAAMQAEAQQEIQHKVNKLASREEGRKAAEEVRQKNQSEQREKAQRTRDEEFEKKQRAVQEGGAKTTENRKEDEQKVREKEQVKKEHSQRSASEAGNKQAVIKATNLEVKKGQRVASAADIKAGDEYTYMFWVFPRGVRNGWTNILHKGDANEQRAPAFFFYPDSSRLHVRSGTADAANDGADPEQPLPINKWTHVVVAHREGMLQVAYNGQVVIEKKGIRAPKPNDGALYAGDPWHEAANAIISDLRYQASWATSEQVQSALKAKRYVEVEVVSPPLKGDVFQPRRNQILANNDRIDKGSEFTYTYMFWVRPFGLVRGWGNLLHKGGSNEARNPAVWFYPASLRLHIRSGTQDNWNNGLDPDRQLPLHQWTHVAFSHRPGLLVVYYNGQEVGRAGLPKPLQNEGPLYASDPWHVAHPSQLADVRYENTFFTEEQVRAVVDLKRYDTKMPPIAVYIHQTAFNPSQGRILKHGGDMELRQSEAWTYTFWLRPHGIHGGWSNVFHKGNSDGQRNPAVWLYPGGTRLHIRTGTQRNWNDGNDPGQSLPLHQWTHVAFVHYHGRFEVYYNGNAVLSDSSLPEPTWSSNTHFYGSNPWYPAAACTVSDLRYYDLPLNQAMIRQIVDENRK